ncbi:MAG: hypothetical protein JWN65_868 [Solirubrobacterales bacterium]|nr:hypothetical protein [Solirubrobacterales bacterium]
MSLPYSTDNIVLVAVQAACVALPAAGLPAWALRLRTGAWALIAPLSIALVVGGLAVLPQGADVLTWVALIGVPLGAALALGCAAHGARAPLALVAAVAFVLAWQTPDTRWGEAGGVLLVAASCVTIGRLLAGVAPLDLLKAGIVAMAVIDAVLVFGNQLQGPNATLVAAMPGGGLPQLQSAGFGRAGMGYGDFFAAGVLGGIVAVEASRRRHQLLAAAAVFAASLLWDLMFTWYDTLPATVPVAAVLLVMEAVRRLRPGRRGRTPAAAGVGPGGLAGERRGGFAGQAAGADRAGGDAV